MPFWQPSSESFLCLLSLASELNVENIELDISGRTKPTPCVKLLGVFIDNLLSLEKYVSELCIRAARQTNALRSIVRHLSPACRIIMYTALTASNLNYCNIEWHFWGHTNSLKIEKVHKNSPDVVLNAIFLLIIFSLKKIKRPTMYLSRMKYIGLGVFICLYTCVVWAISLICFAFPHIVYATRSGSKLIQPKRNTTWNGLNYFRCQGAKIWN